MNEELGTSEATTATAVVDPVVADVESWLSALSESAPAADPAARIDRIRRLEELKGAVAAAQARETVAFKQGRVAERQAAGLPGRQLTRGIGGEVALARRESPHRQSRLVGLAEALVGEMPHTMAALTAGEISEWRATIVAAETACLTLEHRKIVDAELAGRIGSLSDKQLRAAAKSIAYRLDPYAIVNRAARAEKDRHVSSRPVPDTMMNVTATLPVVQGAAVMAALTKAADSARAAGGDDRTRGQVMADTLVERITGQARADQTPIEICLQVTDRTLFSDDPEPGWITGYGPVPAPWIRTLLCRLDDQTKVWVRRFFTDPCTELLSAVDPKRRLIDGILRRAVIFRDQWCRTPWCGAPIRHTDHVTPVADGGQSTEANTQGLCEACNYTKEAPGWRARPGPQGAGESVTITTPTGHTYTSRPPPLPAAEPTAEPRAPAEHVPIRVPTMRWSDFLNRGAA